MAIEIFFSYAHEDEIYLKKLKAQLRVLERQKIIDIMWYDRKISPGIDWEQEIDTHLHSAHVILLLISSDFMDSDYCNGIEMEQALARRERGEARVIPIILRPCLWTETFLGKLQALPAGGKAISTWKNSDEAFFDVARGIRDVLKEMKIQQLARQIALFGYETDGGTNSVLWNNPRKFSDDRNFASWLEMKRPVTREEVVNRIWIKVSNWGGYWAVHFYGDGSLTEHELHDPDGQWDGSWKLIDGILRINIGAYEIDVFANRESASYSAIEIAESRQKEPWSYHVFFPEQEKENKHWNLEDASDLVNRLCKQLVNRQARPEDFMLFGAMLCRGEKSVRDIVKLLAFSPDYREQCINNKTLEQVIDLCYRRLLGRLVDESGKMHYFARVKKTGFAAFILELIECSEYTRAFGEDSVPFFS